MIKHYLNRKLVTNPKNKKFYIMKTNKLYFNFVLVAVIGGFFLMGPTFFNENSIKIDKNSNYLYNSVVSTELSFYTWGGSGSEHAYDIAVDSSNNSYVIGYTNSFGANDDDLCLIKFNSSGVEWNRTYGGTYRDYGRSIALDSLDDIYITGDTYSFGAGGSDMWLLKINSTGGVEWNHTWGGINNEFGWSIAVDSLNNAYVAGETKSFGEGNSDLCLVKFNSSGVVWNYTCGGSNWDKGYSVTLDPLGNPYVIGDTVSFGAGMSDIYLAKFNSTGMVWNYTWGGIENDHGREVIFDQSGDLYVSGYSGITDPEYDITLVKFNSEGTCQWNSTWKEGYFDYSTGMVMDSSGNAYVSGYTQDYNYPDYDMCLVKFNSTGIADWSCTWGGSEMEYGEGVALGSNGTAFVCGRNYNFTIGESDIYLVQFILGQCSEALPEEILELVIPGYDTVILIGLAFAVSIYLIKRKQ